MSTHSGAKITITDPTKAPPLVQVTTQASQEIQRQLEKKANPQMGIRLAVKGGGCSGLSYHLDYDEPKEKDHRLEKDGFKVLVDRKSAIYLKGMTLDFKDGLNDRGFKFVNPNATNTCGCGESFSM